MKSTIYFSSLVIFVVAGGTVRAQLVLNRESSALLALAQSQAMFDVRGELEARMDLAEVYHRARMSKEQDIVLSNGRAGLARISDNHIAAKYFKALGEADLIQGNLGSATADYSKASHLSYILKDYVSATGDLLNVGYSEAQLGSTDQANMAFGQAALLSQRADDASLLPTTLEHIAVFYQVHNQLPRQLAIDYYERDRQALSRWAPTKAKLSQLMAIVKGFRYLQSTENWRQTRLEALRIAESIGDLRDQITLLQGEALGQPDVIREVRALYAKLIAASHSVNERVGAQLGLADFEITIHNFPLAKASLRQAQQIAAMDPSQFDAIDQDQKSLDLATGDRLGVYHIDQLSLASVEPGERIGAYLSLADDELKLGLYPRALRHALNAYSLGDGSLNDLSTLDTLVDIYLDLNQLKEARQYAEVALNLERKLALGDEQSGTISQLGEIEMESGDLNSAIASFYQAIRYATGSLPIPERIELALALNRAGRKTQARTVVLGAFQLLSDRRYESFRAPALSCLSQIDFGLGAYTSAFAEATQSLLFAERFQDRPTQVAALQTLSKASQASGRPEVAIAFGKKAVNVLQSMRADNVGLDTGLQRSFTAKHEKVYRDLADLLISQNRLPEAVHVLDLLKDEEYFEYLRRDPTLAVGATIEFKAEEKAWLDEYDRIAADIEKHGKDVDEFSSITPRTPELQDLLNKANEELKKSMADFEHLIAASPGLEHHKGAEGAAESEDARQLQALLGKLPGETAAVYTVVTPISLELILALPNSPRLIRHSAPISQADLNREIFAFRQELSDPFSKPIPDAAKLFDLVVRPLLPELRSARATTIIWSLDGFLRYIPLGALYDRTTSQYMVQEFPSGIFTPRTVSDLLAAPSPPTSSLGLGVSKAYPDFPALSGVPLEMHSLQQNFNAVILLNDNFTKERMFESLKQDPQYVHFATHFKFGGNVAESYLLTGDGQKLTVDDLNRPGAPVFNGVDLLALSACETAMSDEGDGSEYESFALFAQKQGAQCVLASLWDVDDTATSVLMDDFYRHLKATPGISKMAALTAAQIDFIHTKDPNAKPLHGAEGLDHSLAHPFYWAPFEMIGNWR